VLARLFAAADVFVAPFAEDNLPNVILEALACGTPVVAFAAGGIPDAVEHKENGFLATVGSAAELGRGIGWVLADAARHEQLRRAARASAQTRFDLAACARRYKALFGEIAARQSANAD
jgi:glycosyltransferase involved in cell wall biosynthesis